MNTYYVSLVRGLCGYYVKFIAPTENIVRSYCATYFGRLWCSVYEPPKMDELRTKYFVGIVNEDRPIELEEGASYE